jgi:thermitase
MEEAIEAARDAGILFVAAAGNDGEDNFAMPSYPASYDLANVVSVAATNNSDELADFSNYGKNVHVAAPGVEIYSSILGGNYAAMSGTSMATPHVAGVAALVLSGNPELTTSDLRKRLIDTSTPNRGLRKKVVARGRINAFNAYYGVVPPSAEPDESSWKDVSQSLESAHPYKESTDVKMEVKVPGAKFIRVVFEKVEIEPRYDKIFIQSPKGEVVDTLTGRLTNYISEYLEGDTAVIRFKSDSTVNGWGFRVNKVQVQN